MFDFIFIFNQSAGNSEDAVAVSALDQQVMNDAGQRVVTIVTDQQGHLQTRLTQPLYVTMQNGRQGKGTITSQRLFFSAHVW